MYAILHDRVQYRQRQQLFLLSVCTILSILGRTTTTSSPTTTTKVPNVPPSSPTTTTTATIKVPNVPPLPQGFACYQYLFLVGLPLCLQLSHLHVFVFTFLSDPCFRFYFRRFHRRVSFDLRSRSFDRQLVLDAKLFLSSTTTITITTREIEIANFASLKFCNVAIGMATKPHPETRAKVGQ